MLPRMIPGQLLGATLLMAVGWVAMAPPMVCAADSSDVVLTDQWFVGTLNKLPAMTMHAVVNRHAAGTISDIMDSRVVIKRQLGALASSMEIEDSAHYEENAQGEIVSFQFDHVENGQAPTSAMGQVRNGEVILSVHHLGRSSDERIAIPAGTRLLGQKACQDLLARHSWQPQDALCASTLTLMSNQVHLVTETATFKQKTPTGDLVFDMVMDLMPIPTTMTVTPQGNLVGMSMSFGFFSMTMAPSAGPVPLGGVTMPSTGLVTASGMRPSDGDHNRYALPEGCAAAVDDFQTQVGRVVSVHAQATPVPLADRAVYLRAEPQLELDDPDLRAWVEAIAAKHQADQEDLAEQLRLAVRSYIVHKDLSMGDTTALEAFRAKRGDCKQHAILLCAALRIAGIPARVDVGMVYAESFGGWVGHAWNSAYIAGRWVHLDSAYPGVTRSRYIRLGSTAGGDWKNLSTMLFTNLSSLLGKEVETLKP